MLDKTNTAALDNAVTLAISTNELLEALERIHIAISTEETRYYLNGVYMHVVEGKVHMVATDGHRLSLVKLRTFTDAPTDMPAVIIPRETVKELMAALRKHKKSNWGTVFAFTPGVGHQIILPRDGGSISYDPVDGTFPDYMRVIPRSFDGSATLEGDATRECFSAINGFAKASNANGRATKLNFDGSGLAVITCELDKGLARFGLDCPDFTNNDSGFQVGFNSRYLHEFAKLTTGHIQLRFNDCGSPVALIDSHRANGEFLFVLMPMRV